MVKELLSLEELLKIPTTECSCKRCNEMCSNSRPCWGTPSEIKRLIENGYAGRLMEDYYEGELAEGYVPVVSPALVGNEGRRARFWPIGQCTFFKDIECEIHHLKPIEGRIGDHSNSTSSSEIHFSIMKLWDSPEGEIVAEIWRKECENTWYKRSLL
jgi:hypothetical protein